MKISFDLDDTLILTGENCLYEDSIKFPYSILYKERLRKGTVNLCKELASLGYDICVYTTSERSTRYISKLFKLYGIKLNNIVNQKIHMNIVQGNRKEIMPSKVPSRFGIDLHIDDDVSVRQNGVQYGFKVLIVDKNDGEWDQKVLNEARRIIKLKEEFYNHSSTNSSERKHS
ncbi:MAG TPA: HAD family hydrolase [Clostridia bacterium]